MKCFKQMFKGDKLINLIAQKKPTD